MSCPACGWEPGDPEDRVRAVMTREDGERLDVAVLWGPEPCDVGCCGNEQCQVDVPHTRMLVEVVGGPDDGRQLWFCGLEGQVDADGNQDYDATKVGGR